MAKHGCLINLIGISICGAAYLALQTCQDQNIRETTPDIDPHAFLADKGYAWLADEGQPTTCYRIKRLSHEGTAFRVKTQSGAVGYAKVCRGYNGPYLDGLQP